MGRTASKTKNSGAILGFEEKLWHAADKLRHNLDAAEDKHCVLGRIFLKYISDAFEEHRAKLRVMVKRVLQKYGYPPDLQEKATQTGIEQAELICKDWAAYPI